MIHKYSSQIFQRGGLRGTKTGFIPDLMNLVLGQGNYKFLQPSDGLYGMSQYSYLQII